MSCLIVLTGLDWSYYLATQSPTLQTVLFPAVIIGGLLPMVSIIVLLVIAVIRKDAKVWEITWSMIQAVVIALLVAGFYKALTGRAHPEGILIDNSHIFRFGFWRGGVFWGWPSSHITIAFAMGVTVYLLFPKSRWRYLALVYAFYIGIGVSTNIHWLSDAVAGALIGTSIGRGVAKE